MSIYLSFSLGYYGNPYLNFTLIAQFIFDISYWQREKRRGRSKVRQDKVKRKATLFSKWRMDYVVANSRCNTKKKTALPSGYSNYKGMEN